MSEFKRITEWAAAYDKRAEGYGIHGMELWFTLVGPQAAISFSLSTNWQTSRVRSEYDAGAYRTSDGGRSDGHSKYGDGRIMCLARPHPDRIGYHARERQFESDTAQKDCPYLDGAPCFGDGSGIRAKHFFDIFTDGGEEALWAALREEYDARFVVGIPATTESANFGEKLHALRADLGESEASS
jgi:hypothetical protein